METLRHPVAAYGGPGAKTRGSGAQVLSVPLKLGRKIGILEFPTQRQHGAGVAK